MDQLLLILKLLREIHEHHLTTVGGYRYDLLLANDRAMLALLDGNDDAVWHYADTARCAYRLLEIPHNATLAAVLADLVTAPIPTPAAA
jgi:hypothetical protein